MSGLSSGPSSSSCNSNSVTTTSSTDTSSTNIESSTNDQQPRKKQKMMTSPSSGAPSSLVANDVRAIFEDWRRERSKDEEGDLSVIGIDLMEDESKFDAGVLVVQLTSEADSSCAERATISPCDGGYTISSNVEHFDAVVNSNGPNHSLKDLLNQSVEAFAKYMGVLDEEFEDVEDNLSDEDDGDWGDLVEDDDYGVTDSSGWEKWATTKRRWKDKEEELRKKQKTGLHEIEFKKKNIFSGDAVSTMLMNTLETLMKDEDSPFQVEPVDDNIYHWRVRISQFNENTQLGKDLTMLECLYGYGYVELDIKFPMDIYPFYPPSVRLVRPRLENFMFGRIVCMEELQLAKWNPVRDVTEIFNSIRRLLAKFGHVDTESEVNDPSKNHEPFTELEYQLLRLSMLTETQPRVNYLLSDEDQKSLPSFGVSKMKTSEEPPSKEKKKAKNPRAFMDYGSSDNKGWAAGTGYGHAGSNSDWDVEAYMAAQKKKDSEINSILDQIRSELQSMKPEKTRKMTWLEQSCLIPFLCQYLKNDSMLDMERHADLFTSIFEICSAMAIHSQLIDLFGDLPDQRSSMLSLLKKQEKGARTYRSLTSASSSSSSSSSIFGRSSSSGVNAVDMPKIILECYEKVSTNFRKHQLSTQTSSSSSSTADESKEIGYLEALEDLRFGQVDKFDHHHYLKKSTSERVDRKCMKRLGSEYTDLSTSMPFNDSTSVFMRVHESKMNYCQVMIVGPRDTPYEGGCFLFDVRFPVNYPSGPPLVNLQTTGGGSVRFNPNLYNSGKVCLSLLGTWGGQTQGEKWNSGTSTFLQVAVSIQSLIFVDEPYFNEPGYEREIGTVAGKTHSEDYNKVIRKGTVQFAMIEMLQKPPTPFKEVVRRHFYYRRNEILAVAEGWLGKTHKHVKTLKKELFSLKKPQI